jgi:hypothetical protein
MFNYNFNKIKISYLLTKTDIFVLILVTCLLKFTERWLNKVSLYGQIKKQNRCFLNPIMNQIVQYLFFDIRSNRKT